MSVVSAIGRTRAEQLADYDGMVERAKPKKTTDDCYTPAGLYDIVYNYCVNRYNLTGKEILRPFYPGNDYKDFNYQNNTIVIDNPPFSILTSIIRYYLDNDIKFFLFAPALTGPGASICFEIANIYINSTITYENGVKVRTMFMTNLEPPCVRSSLTLNKEIAEFFKKDKKEAREWGPDIIDFAYVARRIRRDESTYIKMSDLEKPSSEINNTHYGRAWRLKNGAHV